MKIKSDDVVETLARLGKVELQWVTLTWLLCDIYKVVVAEAREAVSEAIDSGKVIHDHGWLHLKEGK